MLGVGPERMVLVVGKDVFRNDGEVGARREGGAVFLEEVVDGGGMVEDNKVGWADFEAEDGSKGSFGPSCKREEGSGDGQLVQVAEEG